MKKSILTGVIVVAALAALFCCQGCTITFRGKEVEVKGEVVKVYDFEKVTFSDGETSY
jgi:hypothetical protein